MKRLFLILATILVISMVCLTGCTGISQEELDLVSKLEKGLESRLDLENSSYSSFEEKQKNIEEGIDIEIKALDGYNSIKYSDEELKTLIFDYVKSLEFEKKGISKMLNDSKVYNEEYVDNGRNKQTEILAKIIENEDYEFSASDDSYKEMIETFINRKPTYIKEVGEKLLIGNENGDIEISIDGLSPMVNKGTFGQLYFLQATIKNISNEQSYVSLDEYIGITDEEGVSMNYSSYGYDYNGYAPCAGGSEEIDKGETKRVAISLDATNKVDEICILLVGEDEMYEVMTTSK